MKNDYPNDDRIERTKQIIKILNFKNGRELTKMYLKNDVFYSDVYMKIW